MSRYKTANKLGRLVLAMAIAGTSLSVVQADDVILYRDNVPSAEELANVMFPSEAAVPDLGPTRGIRFTDEVEIEPVGTSAASTGMASAASSPAASTTGSSVGFNISFEVNSAELRNDALPYLDRVGEMLNLEAAAERQIQISGHADASGDADYNRRLSEARANAVSSYLQSNYGVSADRLMVVGMGENSPLPGTDPFDGVNRRVEFSPIQ